MSKQTTRLTLLVILLAAFGLRLWQLGAQELRGDEAFGYFFSQPSYREILNATLALREPHPVASYYVQKFWLGWVGDSEFALRFVSVWFGSLAVALLIRFAHRLGLPRATWLIAGALLAVSPYAIWHSQDARMYSQSLAWTLASCWLAVEWWQRRGWPWAIGYVTVSWLALHTHYFSAFVLVAQTLFLVGRAGLARRTWATLVAWITLQAILALLYWPWLLAASHILSGYDGNGDSPGLWAMLERSFSLFLVGESTPPIQRPRWAGFAGLLLLGGLIRLCWGRQQNRRAAWLLVLYFAVPLFATWYSSWIRPIFNERYLVAALPPFLLLVAAALNPLPPEGFLTRPRQVARLSPLLLMLPLVIGLAFALQRHYHDPAYSKSRGWRDLATALTRWTAGLPPEQSRIAQNFPDPTLWYYYRGPVAHLVLPPAAHDQAGAAAAVSELATQGIQRVLLPLQPAPQWDDQQIAATALATHYTVAATQAVGVWPLQLYVPPPATLQPLAISFTHGLQLAGYAQQPATLSPEDWLVVQLAWQGAATQLAGTETVFVQLLDEHGQLVAQDDRPLHMAEADPTAPTLATYAILLPADLPAASYRLIAGVYDPAQTGAPRFLTTAGADHVVLREFQ